MDSPPSCRAAVAGLKSARRIACAAEARGNEDLVIIGRTDALGVDGMDEAIRRAELYLQNGADLVFVDGVKRIKDVEQISRRLEGPMILSVVAGNETDALTTQDIQDLGFSMVLYSLDALFAAVAASAAALDHLNSNGTSHNRPPAITYAEFSDLAGLHHHQELDHRYA